MSTPAEGEGELVYGGKYVLKGRQYVWMSDEGTPLPPLAPKPAYGGHLITTEHNQLKWKRDKEPLPPPKVRRRRIKARHREGKSFSHGDFRTPGQP